jgi:integrase
VQAPQPLHARQARSSIPAQRLTKSAPEDAGWVGLDLGEQTFAVVYEGTDPVTGKERHRWHQGGDTRRDAERVLTELVKRVQDGDYRSPERITLGDYLVERWLPVRKSQVGHSTFDSYRRTINSHVLPRIGMIPLQRLTPEDLDGFYSDLLVEGRLNGGGGGGLAPKTVRNIHGMLHKALADACRKGTVQRNVAGLADAPRAKRRSAMQVWNAEQLRQFLAEIEAHRLAPAFYVSANTGMRRGEVLGLHWRDVDFETNRLSVHQAVLNVAYEKRLGDVKTETGRRTIDLDPRTVAVLRKWKQDQREEQVLTGRRASDDDMVFAKPDGEAVHPDYFSQVFDRHVAKSTLPRIRLHDLRHTHVSTSFRAAPLGGGRPLHEVARRLGHSPAVYLSTYGHLSEGQSVESAAVFAGLVDGTT